MEFGNSLNHSRICSTTFCKPLSRIVFVIKWRLTMGFIVSPFPCSKMRFRAELSKKEGADGTKNEI